jgi:hypothetical protein
MAADHASRCAQEMAGEWQILLLIRTSVELKLSQLNDIKEMPGRVGCTDGSFLPSSKDAGQLLPRMASPRKEQTHITSRPARCIASEISARSCHRKPAYCVFRESSGRAVCSERISY